MSRQRRQTVIMRSSLIAVTLLAAGAAPVMTVAGCVREQHLIGEDGPDAGTGGTTSAGTGGAPAGDGGMADADAGSGMTVVSLGDKGSLGWPLAISPEEVARRLSEFLMRAPPSASLTAAVVASAPKTNEDVGQLAEGLLLQEATLAGRQAFYRWWLDLDALATVTRDPSLFPAFTGEVRQALIDETLAFVEDITWRPRGDLSTLLSEPAAFVSPATAAWFPGVVVPDGSAATRVALDASRYAGIVTQPAVVATADWATRTEPSRRGMQLRQRYLCQPVPPEPTGAAPGQVPAGMTVRQWLERNIGPSCSACHGLVDEPGFAFGHFDAVGAYQETEGGLPVETAGLLQRLPDGSQLAFDGAPALAQLLAQLPEVRTCFAIEWLAFATGKFPTAGSLPSAWTDTNPFTADADYVVKRATIQGQLSLRGTIRAVTESHTFLDP